MASLPARLHHLHIFACLVAFMIFVIFSQRDPVLREDGMLVYVLPPAIIPSKKEASWRPRPLSVPLSIPWPAIHLRVHLSRSSHRPPLHQSDHRLPCPTSKTWLRWLSDFGVLLERISPDSDIDDCPFPAIKKKPSLLTFDYRRVAIVEHVDHEPLSGVLLLGPLMCSSVKELMRRDIIQNMEGLKSKASPHVFTRQYVLSDMLNLCAKYMKGCNFKPALTLFLGNKHVGYIYIYTYTYIYIYPMRYTRVSVGKAFMLG